MMKVRYLYTDYIDNLPATSGIYWLFELNKGLLNLVYLGKSRNLRQRLKQHNKTNRLKFDSFAYDFYTERILEKVEKEMLSDYLQRFEHLPKYNKQLG